MSNLARTLVLTTFALGLGATAAFAQEATPAAATPAPQSVQAAPARNDVAGTRAANPNCISDTGSHIRPKAGHCLPVAGTSYSRSELLQTGQIDTARALQMLDPRISVGQ